MIEVVFTDGTVLQFPDRYYYTHNAEHGNFHILARPHEGLVAMLPDRNVLYIRNGDENVSVRTRMR